MTDGCASESPSGPPSTSMDGVQREAVDRWPVGRGRLGPSGGRDARPSTGRSSGRSPWPVSRMSTLRWPRRPRGPRSGGAPRPISGCGSCCEAAALADERAEAIAQTISAEAGKAITEARGEASRSGELIRLAAFEGTQLYGDSLPLDANPGTGFDKVGFTVRQPVGVVVAITPFNYPSLLVLHKVAPALAAGQRGGAQAGPHHTADRPGAGRVLRRRRASRGRAVGAHRLRRRARRRAGQRPAGRTRSRSPGRPPPAPASPSSPG